MTIFLKRFISDWSSNDRSGSRSAQLNHQVIRMLGQLAFEQYIRIPRSDMMDIPRLMLQEGANGEKQKETHKPAL